jgi:membrane fusion protein (multidrug efflux system)
VELPQGVARRAILAPQQAIGRDEEGGASALVVDPRNRVVSRQLQIGRAVGDRWLVTSGLAAGDRLIVEGVDKIKPGDVVSPVVLRRAR